MPELDGNSRRIAWDSDGEQQVSSVTSIEGVMSFNFAEVDQTARFKAWGSGGANATTNDGGTSWSAQVLGTGNILAGARRLDRMVLVGAAPDSGSGPELQVRDLDGDDDYSCPGRGSIDQTELHRACLQYGSSGLDVLGRDLRGVAPWKRDGFLAVGSEGLMLGTMEPLDGGSSLGPYPSWHHVDPTQVPLCDTNAVLSSFDVELHDVARVGPSVIAVGEAGAVWLWRWKEKRLHGCWEEVELGSEFASTTFYGVTADETYEFMEFVDEPGQPYRINKTLSALIVGESGVALRLVIRVDEADDPGVDFTLEQVDSTGLWDDADLHAVSSDDRTRVVVGDDNTLFMLPASSSWADASMWIKREPPGNPNRSFRGIASDGVRYVVVGEQEDDTDADTDSTGVIAVGQEDVHECTLYYTDSDTDPLATASVAARGDCLPPTGALATEDVVWTAFSRREPELLLAMHDTDATWDTDGTLTWLPRKSIASTYFDGAIRFFRTTVLVGAGAAAESYRLTMIPDIGDPLISELAVSSRLLRLPVDGETYTFNPEVGPLDEAPLHLKLRQRQLWVDEQWVDAKFVDVLTGFEINKGLDYHLDSPSDSEDTDGRSYNAARFAINRGVVGGGSEDECGPLPAVDYEELHTGGSEPDDNTTPNCGTPDDNDEDPCYQSDFYLARMSRLRGGSGHEYADMYEAVGEGKQWRYHSMKHYMVGECTSELAASGDPDWVAACCVSEDAPSPVRLPLYAPMDGTLHLYPGTGGGTGNSGVPSREQCGFPEPEGEPFPPGDVQIVFISTDGSIAMLFEHVSSCVAFPSAEGVVVEAGDRIGEWSAHRTFDIITFLRDEEDRWRLISYFDLLPPELYGMYRKRFGLASRGSGAANDPVISLKERDRCPMRPRTDTDVSGVDEKVTNFDLVLETGCVWETDPEAGADTDLWPKIAPPNFIEFP